MTPRRADDGLLRRVTLAELLLPQTVRGVAARLLYVLFLYPWILLILLMVGIGLPSRLLLIVLPAISAPDWLTVLLGTALLLLAACWTLAAAWNGVVWVAAGRYGGPAPEPEWGLRAMVRTAKSYWRELEESGRKARDSKDR